MDDDDRDDADEIDPECLIGWAAVSLIVWAWLAALIEILRRLVG